MGDRISKALSRAVRVAKLEGGFVVPTSLFMVLAAFATVSVGVGASIQAQQGTVRDQGTKSALQVAEAGVSQALLHFNRSSLNPCVGLAAGSGWCGPVTGAFNGGTFAYYVLPNTPADWSPCPPPQDSTRPARLEVVASGNLGDEVSRRIHVTACSSSGTGIFADYAVKGKDSIVLNAEAEIHAGTATNGSITLNNLAKQCGQAQVGVGQSMIQSGTTQYTSDTDCTQPSATYGQEELTLPTVNQGNAATSNQNSYFFAQNPVSGKLSDTCWNGLDADGTSGTCGQRELSINNNTSVTLQGGVYSFCKLVLRSNSALYVAAGAGVTIYFDSPEACGLSDGATQLEMHSSSRITTNGGPATNVSLLFVGSPSLRTRATLSSNTVVNSACGQNFVVYAPRTDLILNADSVYCGGIAGKTVTLNGRARIFPDSALQNWQLPNTPPHYEVARFVECTAAPQTPPDAGC
jgi:hypothetical protein